MTGGSRVAAVTVLALLSAGCATSSSESGRPQLSASHQRALKFSACMRTNGVGEFPDPTKSGNLTLARVVNVSFLDPDAPAWKAAIAVCEDLEPAGFERH